MVPANWWTLVLGSRAGLPHDQTGMLDASLLMMPLTDVVVPSDPMWLSTLDAMDAELVSDSLVYRYNPSACLLYTSPSPRDRS